MVRPKADISNRKCYGCGCDGDSSKKWISNGILNQFLCGNCYSRYISNPNRTKAVITGYNERRITFGKKQIYIKKNPRKGKCQKCHKKKLTGIHHEKFGLFPLDYTLELCQSCHMKRGWELGQYDSKNRKRV